MSTGTITTVDVESLRRDTLGVNTRERDWSEGYGETWGYLQSPTCPQCGDYTAWVNDDEMPAAVPANENETRKALADIRAFGDGAEIASAQNEVAEMTDEEVRACLREEGIKPGSDDIVAWRCQNDQCSDYGAEVEQGEGPMMSYDYPLPSLDYDYDQRDAEKIAHLPLCIVTYEDGTYSLALTGGGMDLRWEICEAFILLDFLPPVGLADVPAMCGRGATGNDGSRGHAISARDAAIISACRRSAKLWREEAENTGSYLTRNLDMIEGTV